MNGPASCGRDLRGPRPPRIERADRPHPTSDATKPRDPPPRGPRGPNTRASGPKGPSTATSWRSRAKPARVSTRVAPSSALAAVDESPRRPGTGRSRRTRGAPAHPRSRDNPRPATRPCRSQRGLDAVDVDDRLDHDDVLPSHAGGPAAYAPRARRLSFKDPKAARVGKHRVRRPGPRRCVPRRGTSPPDARASRDLPNADPQARDPAIASVPARPPTRAAARRCHSGDADRLDPLGLGRRC